MNKISLGIVSLSLLAFASCDYDAGSPEHSEQQGIYYGDLSVLLYTPDRDIEVDNYLAWSMEDGELAGSTVFSGIIVDIQDVSSMSLCLAMGDTISFALPFLETPAHDGSTDIRTVFSGGQLAALYYSLHEGAEAGLVAADTLRHFDELISVLRDTIIITDLKFGYDVTEYGNALASFNKETGSMYASIAFPDIKYTRKTNLSELQHFIQPTLDRLYTQGLMEKDMCQILSQYTSNYSTGTIKNPSGKCISSIAQYTLSFSAQITKSEGMLQDLASMLYGRDAQTGKPLDDIWLVFYYSGEYDFDINSD